MSHKDTASSDRSSGSGIFTPARTSLLVLVLLAVVFVIENTLDSWIRLLIPDVSMPLYLALAAVAVIGAVCGGYFMHRRK